MLKKIGIFVVKLYLFGMSFSIIDTVISFFSDTITYSTTSRVVILFLWSIIPGIYLLKGAKELFEEAQKSKET